jgi:hypothetical protein
MSTTPTLAIIRASLTGAKAAEAARDAGFDGRIMLIGEEPGQPYERPPLSKAVLRGEKDADRLERPTWSSRARPPLIHHRSGAVPNTSTTAATSMGSHGPSSGADTTSTVDRSLGCSVPYQPRNAGFAIGDGESPQKRFARGTMSR